MAKAVIISLLLLSMVITANAFRTAKALEKIGGALHATNTGLGIFSRSMIVSSVSKALRGEDAESVNEALRQAIVTLSVLDVGGGILVPIAQQIVDVITTDRAFQNTANAWKSMGARTDFLDSLQPERLGNFLRDEKENVLRAFKSDVDALPNGHRTLKHIKKAQKWLRLKAAANVLGPIFDLVSIGVNSWSLGTTIRDCVATPSECNRGGIASASLSIASGVVGVVTFGLALNFAASAAIIGPAGAILGFALAIAATIIELTYTPPPSQAEVERQSNERKEFMMLELDRYSRMQLYIANKFISESKIEKSDLYIANQGHLPKWFDYPDSKIKYGRNYDSNPRQRNEIPQKCDHPIRGFGSFIPPGSRHNLIKCPYLVDGVALESTLTSGKEMGFGFYGFTKKDREYEKWRDQQPYDDVPYNGTILLVSTDKVQEGFLTANDVNAKLRGMEIYTDTKSGDAAKPFNDLISIGDMPNLDRGEKITIVTGAGNDALNIDGRLGDFENPNYALEVTLGTGENTLSFNGMANDSPIKGIEFDSKNEILRYKYGSVGQKQDVALIRGVSILAGSPFDDYIKLHAKTPTRRRSTVTTFDFTVIKFHGSATYEIDVSDLASQSATINFKIIDGTDNSNSGCEDHTPVLKLTNFNTGAYANDILYRKDKIKIYGERSSGKRSLKKSHEEEKRYIKDVLGKKSDVCSGEPEGEHPKGGEDGKVLLAKVFLNSKCPVEIHASNQDGSCMMAPRKAADLDIRFFDGVKLDVDFTTRVYRGGRGNDCAVLKCPDNIVTTRTKINLRGGANDFLVIGREKFLDPCDIDGDETKITLEKRPNKRNNWVLKLQGVAKFNGRARRIILRGIDKIINELGNVVVNLSRAQESTIDLYDRYTRVTMQEIGNIAGRDRSQEIKDNLLKCIKEESEMTDEEKEICKTMEDQNTG